MGQKTVQELANGATIALTIADGETTSSAAALLGAIPAKLHIPSGFEGTTVTFTISPFGTTYHAFYDQDNAAVSMTVAAGRSYELPLPQFLGIRYLKVIAGTAQTGAATLYLDVA